MEDFNKWALLAAVVFGPLVRELVMKYESEFIWFVRIVFGLAVAYGVLVALEKATKVVGLW